MADDPEVVEEKVDAAPLAEPEKETPEVATPHPLEPGGPRFEEVYRRMKEAEARDMENRDRIARLEGQAQVLTRQPSQPQQQTFTPDQLQALVDQGRISPAQMAHQISWQ